MVKIVITTGKIPLLQGGDDLPPGNVKGECTPILKVKGGCHHHPPVVSSLFYGCKEKGQDESSFSHSKTLPQNKKRMILIKISITRMAVSVSTRTYDYSLEH